jgi:hypothetical protein
MPAKIDIPRPYAPAPPARAEDLDGVYATCVAAAGQAALALDRAAAALDAPSQFLAAARTAAAARPAAGPPRSFPVIRSGPGAAEKYLRELGVRDPGDLLRAAALDTSMQTLAAGAAYPGRRPRRPRGGRRPGADPPRRSL